MTPADLDGDGAQDLVVRTSSRLEAWMNSGDGAFSKDAVISPGWVRPPAAADFDGDGDTDVAFGVGFELAVAFNRGDGSFSAPSTFALPAEAAFLVARDLDDDRDVDLVAGSGSASSFTQVVLATNRGDGTFRIERRYTHGVVGSMIAADLDADGLDDILLVRGLLPLFNRSKPPESADRDGDGVPDECPDVLFRRGDANQDGRLDLADAVLVLRSLFLGSPPVACLKAADADDSGGLGLTDAVRILAHVFLARPAPPEPFPSCGADPTEDPLSCKRFRPCP